MCSSIKHCFIKKRRASWRSKNPPSKEFPFRGTPCLATYSLTLLLYSVGMDNSSSSISDNSDMINDTISSGPVTPTKKRTWASAHVACNACRKGHRRCDNQNVCNECSRLGDRCIRPVSRKRYVERTCDEHTYVFTPHRPVSAAARSHANGPMHVPLKLRFRPRAHITLSDNEAIQEAAHALMLLAKRYCGNPETV